jgi:hypothetical protein
MMDLKYLQRWTRPDSFADFADFDRREYFVAAGQHRDSDTLTRSNFRSILAALGGESETVIIVRDSHFAVGWVEAVYIHESDSAALATADAILERLEGYPVVDEDDWSGLEYAEAAEYWGRLSVSERLDYCQKYRCSPFAARRADLPDDPQGGLVSALADGH